MPHCCQYNETNSTLVLSAVHTTSVFVGSNTATTGNCSELNKVILLEHVDLHITPAVNMVLAIGGLIVSVFFLCLHLNTCSK